MGDVTAVDRRISVDDSSYLIINRNRDVAIEIGLDNADASQQHDVMEAFSDSLNNDDDAVFGSSTSTPKTSRENSRGSEINCESETNRGHNDSLDTTNGSVSDTTSLVSVAQLSSVNSFDQERDADLEAWLAENNIQHSYDVGDSSTSSEEEGTPSLTGKSCSMLAPHTDSCCLIRILRLSLLRFFVI